jgi:hypothetical protein
MLANSNPAPRPTLDALLPDASIEMELSDSPFLRWIRWADLLLGRPRSAEKREDLAN